jgi:prophage regulatory protein
MSHQILRMFEVSDRIGLAKSSIYEQIRKGSFPKPIKLSPRSVGWLEADINSWLDEKVSQSLKADTDG